MEDKEAIKTLTEMTEKYPLTEKEKEAVRDAIGILSWSKLLEGYIKSRKAKKGREEAKDVDA